MLGCPVVLGFGYQTLEMRIVATDLIDKAVRYACQSSRLKKKVMSARTVIPSLRNGANPTITPRSSAMSKGLPSHGCCAKTAPTLAKAHRAGSLAPISPTIRLTKKLTGLQWHVCSSGERFLSWSLTVRPNMAAAADRDPGRVNEAGAAALSEAHTLVKAQR